MDFLIGTLEGKMGQVKLCIAPASLMRFAS